MIRLFLLSPSPAVRLGVRALLEPYPSLQVSGDSASLEEISEHNCDVLIYAPAYGASVGLQLPLELVESGISLLLLSEEPEAVRYLTGLPVRSWGLLSPAASAEELAAAIQALQEGLVLLDAGMAKKLVSFPASRPVDGDMPEPLTERETEVLQWLAQGLANKQIAARLNVSTHTVKYHIASIYGKLGATNRTEAVRFGLQKGLVTL